MSDERRRILDMLEQGKVSAEEAEKLLDAIARGQSSDDSSDAPAIRNQPRYLRVVIKEGTGENVNIRVPLQLLRAGVKMQALLPDQAKTAISEAMESKGIDFDQLSNAHSSAIDELIEALGDLSLDITDEEDNVRIFCE